MNTSRLLELVNQLLAVEAAHPVNNALSKAAAAMQGIVNQPNQAEAQTQYADRFNVLRERVLGMNASFSPADIELMEEIGAQPYFAANIAEQIEKESLYNAVTPAVVLAKITSVRDQRQTYIQLLQQLKASLEGVGILTTTLRPGEAELSILLPRTLFENRFDELIDELGEINKILRIFSEIVTGDVSVVEVKQISTTDPIFGLAMDAAIIGAIGAAITWGLDTWERIARIRKLRADSQEVLTKEEIEAFFDTKIKKTIDEAVAAKATELFPTEHAEAGRKHELRNALEWALNSIMYRIERGMRVEICFLPPTQTEGAPPVPEPVATSFATLAEVVPKLKFPDVKDPPVLQLPPTPPPR